MVCAAISAQPIEAASHETLVAQASAGAVVTFCGTVRDHDADRRVLCLEYVGHPSAEETVRVVAGRVAEITGVLAVAVSHRVGTLAVGDIALVATVSSAHREAAFAACARLVDELKHELPIWKRQVFDDGTDEWVNCP